MNDTPDLTAAEIGPRATLTEETIAMVACAFDLGAVDGVRDLGGAYNLNVLLRTAHGMYVMRVYRP